MEEQDKNFKKIEESLNLIKEKKSKIYVLTQDTKGNPKASVTYIYELVKELVDNGYDAHILHEKSDYKIKSTDSGDWLSVSDWLGEEYSELPHACVESGGLSVGPQDILIVPELFGHVMEQTKDMACTKIVLCQSYDYIFEMLQPGVQWLNYGYTYALTTSEMTKEYIKSVFPTMDVSIIPISISDKFKNNKLPGQPLVAIHTRDPRDTMKIVKTFYARYPQFKWVTFRDMRGMSIEDFANTLNEVCVGVWVDDISGFGTFPLECMKTGVPVIGKIPNLKPEWLEEDNGFWSYEYNQLVDVINSYIKTWLEDSVPTELLDKMDNTVKKYSVDNRKKQTTAFIERVMGEKVVELENALNKFTVNEEK
jgi:hypothetical protein